MREKRRRRVLPWLIVMTAGIVVVIAIGPGGSGGSPVDARPAPPIETYQREGAAMNYRAALLGDYEEGALLTVRGQVAQVFRETNVLIDTEENEFFGFAGEKVWLRFATEPRLVADDIITVYGRYDGTQRYESAIGTEEEVPRLVADHVIVDGE